MYFENKLPCLHKYVLWTSQHVQNQTNTISNFIPFFYYNFLLFAAGQVWNKLNVLTQPPESLFLPFFFLIFQVIFLKYYFCFVDVSRLLFIRRLLYTLIDFRYFFLIIFLMVLFSGSCYYTDEEDLHRERVSWLKMRIIG